MMRTGWHGMLFLMIAAGIVAVGVLAARSTLFVVREVVIAPIPKDIPITEKEILDLAQIPIGQTKLFGLDLKPVEDRILQHPWVKKVWVAKEFTGKIHIVIVPRIPVAQLEHEGNRIAYVESDGSVFEVSDHLYQKILPFLSGWNSDDTVGLADAVAFIDSWSRNQLPADTKLVSLDQSESRGIRATLILPLKNDKILARPVVELGFHFDEALQVPRARLLRVLHYLQKKHWAAQRIWLGDGKKIVVKTSLGP